MIDAGEIIPMNKGAMSAHVYLQVHSRSANKDTRLKIEMKNAPSFLGYSRLSAEITANAIDHREQIDLSTEHPLPLKDAPRHYNLLAPNQWPSEKVLPNFRPVFTDYMKRMGEISVYFTSLIAEAIELPSDAFNKYFDGPGGKDQQHKLKIVKYPDVGELGGDKGNQGVGPHKDSSMSCPVFLSFSLLAVVTTPFPHILALFSPHFLLYSPYLKCLFLFPPRIWFAIYSFPFRDSHVSSLSSKTLDFSRWLLSLLLSSLLIGCLRT